MIGLRHVLMFAALAFLALYVLVALEDGPEPRVTPATVDQEPIEFEVEEP